MMQQKSTATDEPGAYTDQQKVLIELSKQAGEHVLRFGALANTGGVAACLSILGASASTGAVEKTVLVPLIPFLLGILSVWLSLFVLRERMRRDNVRSFGEVETQEEQKYVNRQLAKTIEPLYENGRLVIASLVLFCVGVLLGFIVIIFA